MSTRHLLPLAACLAALALPSVAGAAELVGPVPPTPAYVPGKVIVEWAAGAGHGAKVEAREGAEVEYESDLGDPSFQLVGVEAGQSVADAIEELEGAPAVKLAERDSYAVPTAVPNDPLFGEEWALQNEGAGIDGASGAVAGDDIGALDAWERTIGTQDTVVADIDTGYRFDSPDLGPVAWENPGEIAGNGVDDDGNGYVDDVHGWDFVGNDSEAPTEDSNPTDEDLVTGGHGLHTAGIIGAAGNNGVGITGVAQNVRIMPLRVCANAPKLEASACPTSSTIAAINYAGHNGARVANLSLGGTTWSTAELDAFAENPGTLYVIAAGNDAEDNDLYGHYPCDYEPGTTGIAGAAENIVCVAATNQADELASFSDWGSSSVDLGAPGTEILSVYPASETEISDDFEEENFTTNWSAIGAGGGFERTDEAPLTSWGISDSPGAAPVAKSTRTSTWRNPVAVPAADGGCKLSGLDSVVLAGGTASLVVTRNQTAAYTFNLPETSGSGMSTFQTVPMTGLDGSSVGLRVRYAAGSSPTAAAGLWLDDLKLTCNASLSTPPTYAFLQGTSMAAPMVSGTAALLFSAKPSASVEEVAEALIEGADPDPSLAGKTVSGGRLDAARALEWLEPPAPVLTGFDPEPTVEENGTADILGTAMSGTRVSIFEGVGCHGTARRTGTPAELESPGFYVKVPAGTRLRFSARVETPRNSSPCSASILYWNPSVPVESPSLHHTVPASPGANEHPLIVGYAPEATAVTIYSGASCSGTPIASGSAAELASPGIEVSVGEGEEGTFSATATETEAPGETSGCSPPMSYRQEAADTEPPAPPSLRTSPASPAANEHPRVLGSAEAGSTVRIYAGAGCKAPDPIARGSAAELESTGFQVTVPAATTREFTATATDAAGNTSACSAPVSFTNSTPVGPVTSFLFGENPQPTGQTPTATGCTVPKLVGRTLAKAKAMLRGAGCKVGKVVEPKIRPKRAKAAMVVAASNPKSGKTTSRAVSLRLAARRG